MLKLDYTWRDLLRKTLWEKMGRALEEAQRAVRSPCGTGLCEGEKDRRRERRAFRFQFWESSAKANWESHQRSFRNGPALSSPAVLSHGWEQPQKAHCRTNVVMDLRGQQLRPLVYSASHSGHHNYYPSNLFWYIHGITVFFMPSNARSLKGLIIQIHVASLTEYITFIIFYFILF